MRASTIPADAIISRARSSSGVILHDRLVPLRPVPDAGQRIEDGSIVRSTLGSWRLYCRHHSIRRSIVPRIRRCRVSIRFASSIHWTYSRWCVYDSPSKARFAPGIPRSAAARSLRNVHAALGVIALDRDRDHITLSNTEFLADCFEYSENRATTNTDHRPAVTDAVEAGSDGYAAGAAKCVVHLGRDGDDGAATRRDLEPGLEGNHGHDVTLPRTDGP